MSRPRTSTENKALYVSHRLSEPSYPQTIIIPIGINDYEIHYAHGQPLSKFTIDDCPDSVFNYDCHYYKSLQSLKNNYTNNLKHVKFQLEAFNEDLMEDYINERIDALYIKYSESVRSDIKDLKELTPEDIIRDVSNGAISIEDIHDHDITSLSEDLLSDLSEKQTAFDSVQSVAYDELYAEWFDLHQTTPNSRPYLEDLLSRWELGLGNLENEFRAWKEDALKEAIEYEKQFISEYQTIPLNGKDFKKQIQSICRTNIAAITQDVKNSSLDIIITKLPKSAIDKYESQLNTLIFMHSKCKCHRYIDSYMEVIRGKVNTTINKLKVAHFDSSTTDWYDLKKTIFPVVESTIKNLAHELFSEINERLNLIPSYLDNTITNMEHMKRLSTTIITGINENLRDMDDVISGIDNSYVAILANCVNKANETYAKNCKYSAE